MESLGVVLWPLIWLVEAILAATHAALVGLGAAPDSGATWIASIAVLVLLIRLALLPLIVGNIRAQRRYAALKPEIERLMRQNLDADDPASRERVTARVAAMYREARANPLSRFVPILVQAPVFVALYVVVSRAGAGQPGAGLMDAALSASFSRAQVGDVLLHETLGASEGDPAIVAVAIGILLALLAVLTTTRILITRRQQQAGLPMVRLQFAIGMVLSIAGSITSAILFPIAVNLYLLIGALISLVLGWIVVPAIGRRLPDAVELGRLRSAEKAWAAAADAPAGRRLQLAVAHHRAAIAARQPNRRLRTIERAVRSSATDPDLAIPDLQPAFSHAVELAKTRRSAFGEALIGRIARESPHRDDPLLQLRVLYAIGTMELLGGDPEKAADAFGLLIGETTGSTRRSAIALRARALLALKQPREAFAILTDLFRETDVFTQRREWLTEARGLWIHAGKLSGHSRLVLAELASDLAKDAATGAVTDVAMSVLGGTDLNTALSQGFSGLLDPAALLEVAMPS